MGDSRDAKGDDVGRDAVTRSSAKLPAVKGARRRPYLEPATLAIALGRPGGRPLDACFLCAWWPFGIRVPPRVKERPRGKTGESVGHRRRSSIVASPVARSRNREVEGPFARVDPPKPRRVLTTRDRAMAGKRKAAAAPAADDGELGLVAQKQKTGAGSSAALAVAQPSSRQKFKPGAVSYTHLTLPTKRIV